MMARIRSFAVTPRRSAAADVDGHASSACRCSRHCVASTWPTSVVPMPKARRAECAVRRGVAVAADDGLAGLRRAQLRADDVHDAAVLVPEAEQFDAELGAVLLERTDLQCGRLDRDRCVAEDLLGARRSRVVHGREGQVGATDRQPALAQHAERLWRGHFVDEMQVDVQHRRRLRRFGHDFVLFPDLLEQCLRGQTPAPRSRRRASRPVRPARASRTCRASCR